MLRWRRRWHTDINIRIPLVSVRLFAAGGDRSGFTGFTTILLEFPKLQFSNCSPWHHGLQILPEATLSMNRCKYCSCCCVSQDCTSNSSQSCFCFMIISRFHLDGYVRYTLNHQFNLEWEIYPPLLLWLVSFLVRWPADWNCCCSLLSETQLCSLSVTCDWVLASSWVHS